LIAMPALTRRRYPERQDCWHVFYGDVQIGTIARRVGCPVDVDQWQWICGFCPGMDPGQYQDGTVPTFEDARADSEAAWRRLPTRTEADFQAWRDQRDWSVWKYAMRDRGLRLPTEFADGRGRCFCGAVIDTASLDQHVRGAHSATMAAA
jgi:hypothetical protein